MPAVVGLEPEPIAEVLPYPWNCAVTRQCVLHVTAEDIAVARCPICRHVLVARQGRTAPYFHCGCSRTGAKSRAPQAAEPAVPVTPQVGEPSEVPRGCLVSSR